MSNIIDLNEEKQTKLDLSCVNDDKAEEKVAEQDAKDGKDWGLKIDWDEKSQVVTWQLNSAKVKNLEFAMAMLDLAKQQLEHTRRQIHAQQAMQMAQQAQHDAMIANQLRRPGRNHH